MVNGLPIHFWILAVIFLLVKPVMTVFVLICIWYIYPCIKSYLEKLPEE